MIICLITNWNFDKSLLELEYNFPYNFNLSNEQTRLLLVNIWPN